MHKACKEFLKALKQTEGQSVQEIGRGLRLLPAGATAEDVYERCQQLGWIMGTSSGPWLTPEGVKVAEAPDSDGGDSSLAATMPAKRILIVEDDPVQREGLVRILEQHGYIAIPTASAQEALQWLEAGPAPDLILLDMFNAVSRSDGWDLLRRRHQDRALAAIPVLIMTALGVACKEWALDLGAVGLLKKPFDASQLLEEVGRRCAALPGVLRT